MTYPDNQTAGRRIDGRLIAGTGTERVDCSCSDELPGSPAATVGKLLITTLAACKGNDCWADGSSASNEHISSLGRQALSTSRHGIAEGQKLFANSFRSGDWPFQTTRQPAAPDYVMEAIGGHRRWQSATLIMMNIHQPRETASWQEAYWTVNFGIPDRRTGRALWWLRAISR